MIAASGGRPAVRATCAIASAAEWLSLPAPVKITTGAAPPAWRSAQVRALARVTSSGRGVVRHSRAEAEDRVGALRHGLRPGPGDLHQQHHADTGGVNQKDGPQDELLPENRTVT